MMHASQQILTAAGLVQSVECLIAELKEGGKFISGAVPILSVLRNQGTAFALETVRTSRFRRGEVSSPKGDQQILMN